MTPRQKTKVEILLGKKAVSGPLKICPAWKVMSSLTESPDKTMGCEVKGEGYQRRLPGHSFERRRGCSGLYGL